jgi:hypothetical protein
LAFWRSGIIEFDLSALTGGLVFEERALECCASLVSLVLPAKARAGSCAFSGLKSLKQLRVESLAGLDKSALDGTKIDEIELSGTIDDLKESLQHAELLARLAPTRIVHEGREIEVKDEVSIARLIKRGRAKVPTAEALDLAVVGEMPPSFPECVRFLDLLEANATKLTSVRELPFLRRLIVPAVVEEIGRRGVERCPRLEEVIFGDAPILSIICLAFNGDFGLERLSLPSSLRDVWLEGTMLSRLDASECGFLELFTTSSLPTFAEVVLPSRFSRAFWVWCKSIGRAAFGSIELNALCQVVLLFDEVRFTALKPPRGDFSSEMVAKAFVFGEPAELFGREAAPARPP